MLHFNLKLFAMKKLLLLAIVIMLAACQKDNTIIDQTDLTTAVSERGSKNHPVPFHATFISTVIPPVAPDLGACGTGYPVLRIYQTLDGNATHMGNITGTISSCLNISTGARFNRSFTLEAANGDLLYIYEFVITGGTGRFEDATGSVTGTFVPIAPGQFDTVLDGEIQY
jgi:hypothetical protein